MVDGVQRATEPVPPATRPASSPRPAGDLPAAPPPAPGDSSNLSPQAQHARRPGDIDVEISFSAQGTTLHGRVDLPQKEVQEILKHALDRSQQLYNVQVEPDGTGGYKIQARCDVDWIPDPSISFTIKPQVKDGNLQFQLADVDVTGPTPAKVQSWAAGVIGDELKKQGLARSIDPTNHTIELDTQALLKRQAEQTLGKIDWSRQSTRMEVDARGDLHVTFTENGRETPAPDTDPSQTNVQVKLDGPRILEQLNQRFGNKDVKFQAVELKEGSLRVTADVSYVGGGSAMLGMLGLFTMAAGLAGDASAVYAGAGLVDAAEKGKHHRDASLEVLLDANQLTINTTDRKVLDQLEQFLRERHISATRTDGQISVASLRAIPEFKKITGIRMTPEGLTIDGQP